MNRNLIPLTGAGVLVGSVLVVVAFYGARALLAPAGVGGMHPALDGGSTGGFPWPIQAAVALAIIYALIQGSLAFYRMSESPGTKR